MSTQADIPGAIPEPTPEVVAHLLAVVSEHSVEVALSDIERTIAQLRADTVVASEAREMLRTVPTAVLREALRLRAARLEAVR